LFTIANPDAGALGLGLDLKQPCWDPLTGVFLSLFLFNLFLILFNFNFIFFFIRESTFKPDSTHYLAAQFHLDLVLTHPFLSHQRFVFLQ